MDKIYRRTTQRGETPKKKKNEKNRVRNTFMNFRVTPTEKDLIEARISMSGLSKSKYFIESCLYQTILVKGNIRTFNTIRSQIKEISDEINRTPNLEKMDPVQMEKLRMILEILQSMFKE